MKSAREVEEMVQDIDNTLQSLSGEGAEEEFAGSLLTGWVLVAEWAAPDGTRFLTRFHPDHVAIWQADGYMTHAQAEMRNKLGGQ